MRNCIVKLFNLFVKFEYIPDNFKLGIIVPVPKGNKPLTNQDNYRGITLQPVFCKIFEKCIMARLDKWSRSNNIIHRPQGANQRKCSCIETSLIVQEVIAK